MTAMDLEMFTKHVERIQKHSEDRHALSELLGCYDVEYGDRLLNSVVELLVDHFNDKSEWISYWLWELDFGTKYTDGSVTFDGISVPLKTIKDLYKVLVDNMNREE